MKSARVTISTLEKGKNHMRSRRLKPFWQISGLTLDELDPEMKTVTFGVSSIEENNRRVKTAFRGVKQTPRIDFASAELMFKIMTAKRWEIVRVMAGGGPVSVREVARRVKRDVKGVHTDVQALLKCGVLYKTEAGQVIFPFSAVHVDVMVEAA